VGGGVNLPASGRWRRGVLQYTDARIPVIFITWATTADTAIEAMKDGAYDYLFKPLDLARLRDEERAEKILWCC
jgi:DNA-binding NtrC family response regulator